MTASEEDAGERERAAMVGQATGGTFASSPFAGNPRRAPLTTTQSVLRVTLLVLCILLTLCFVVLSPVGLSFITGSNVLGRLTLNWSLLSESGQAYGAIAAVLSGFALLGIGATLSLQARQVRIAQIQAANTFQLELFRIAYEHRDLEGVWSQGGADTHSRDWRQATYRNLIFRYLQAGFTTGAQSETSVRRTLINRFKTQDGRDFWLHTRDSWWLDAHGRTGRRFVRIADECFLTTSGAFDPKPIQNPNARPAGSDGTGEHLVSKNTLAVATGVVGALAIAVMCRSRRR